MSGLDERRWRRRWWAGGGRGGGRQVEVGEVLTILTHTSPQIAPPSGGWEDKGRNEKLAIHSDDMCLTGAHHHIMIMF